MARIGLVSPWVEFYRKIEAMFKYDKYARVIYNEEENVLKIYVENGAKANALAELLPCEKTFGNVTMKIEVIPANKAYEEWDFDNVFEAALCGNEALSYVRIVSGIFASDLVYVVFKNEVVQYYNDSLGDVHGFCSTLYQEIAKDIFNPIQNTYYCTDLPADLKLGMPLGEWP